MENDVAKKLFEIAQTYVRWNGKDKIPTWEQLPDSVKHFWFEKARDVIGIVESYCPFSPKHRIELER